MEKVLITPEEVVQTVFRQAEMVGEGLIGEAVIMSAQQKFLKPVLNGLFAPLFEGGYPQLVEEYIKPALAMYVKLLLMPVLAVRSGALGVVQAKGSHFQPAADKALAHAERQVRKDALALIRRAVEHIEEFPGRYPEYDRRENILNRVAVDGGLVLQR